MITTKSCPICKSNQITTYNQSGVVPGINYEIMPNVFVNAATIAYYFVCQNCHIFFQNPRLSDQELDKFYSEGFYLKTLNIQDEERDKDELLRAKFDAKIIQDNLGKIKSHLDVGASRGYLLDEVGANVKVGVELNTADLKVTGIEIYTTLDQVPQKAFDLVTIIHTLEHVSDPVSYLMKMKGLLSQNGHLVIEVPTWKSPGGPLRLPHLYHFEPDVLRLLCQRVGLKIITTEFTPHLLLICKLDKI